MFSCVLEDLNPRCQRRWVFAEERRLTFAEVTDLWQGDEAFRDFFVTALTDCPFAAVRWETPPVNAATMDRDFEFVLLDCPNLARPVDRRAFDSFFQTGESKGVAVFENLGRDALLIAPCPTENDGQFSHLNGFLKEGLRSQVHELWRRVGQHLLERVTKKGAEPVWLSTAGMGVAWLHVRLDSYPKYYGYTPYRAW